MGIIGNQVNRSHRQRADVKGRMGCHVRRMLGARHRITMVGLDLRLSRFGYGVKTGIGKRCEGRVLVQS
jgi:hypothetical protein